MTSQSEREPESLKKNQTGTYFYKTYFIDFSEC